VIPKRVRKANMASKREPIGPKWATHKSMWHTGFAKEEVVRL
jgi:hypothetical protein